MNRKSFLLIMLIGILFPWKRLLGSSRTKRLRPVSTKDTKIPNDFDYDVLVVGAGAAGVYGAAILKQSGLRVCILEARDRIGGRVKSIRTKSGNYVELGGQWLAKTGQNRLSTLVKKYSYKSFKNPEYGDDVIVENKDSIRIPHGDLPLSLTAKIDSLRFGYYLSRKIDKIKESEPKNLVSLDHLNFKEWLNEKLWTTQSRRFWTTLSEQSLCCDPEKVSVFEALMNLSTIGSLEILEEADHFYFKDGLSRIFERLVSDHEIDLKLKSQVNTITQTQDCVRLKGSFGELTAQYALLTLPPQLYEDIAFEPPLPTSLSEVITNPVLGKIVKVVAIYNRPWWRDQGFSGSIQSKIGPFDFVIDSSFEGAKEGVLVGLAQSSFAEKLNGLTGTEIKNTFIQQLLSAFGASFDPDEFYLTNWNEEVLSRGGFSSRRALGEWALFGDVFSRPEGRIYFAGTECAKEWRGYIEGALESGERQALNICKLIKGK
jgi:monoamine oxidase